MIKTFFIYLGYSIAAVAFTGFSYLNLAPQFGSNPSAKKRIEYEKLLTMKMEALLILKIHLFMTGNISTWDFFKSDS